MKTEIVNVYKIKSVNKDNIGAFIVRYVPTKCIVIPLNKECYIIENTEDNNNLLDKDTITYSLPTRKSKVFLIYSLVKSYEITLIEKCDKNIPDFLILGEYRKYIQEKYNVKDDEKVDKIGKMIVNSLADFIDFEAQ
jgi:hypothetical protein